MTVTATRAICTAPAWELQLKPECRQFVCRFSRCRGLLRFTARKLLGDSRKAQLAVENCWWTAYHTPQSFDREGAFRSWLLRILIEEALALLRRDQAQASRAARFAREYRATEGGTQ